MRKLFALLLFLMAAPVWCVPVFDTSLMPPSTYYGAGNTNDHWTANYNGTVEIAGRIINRGIGSIAPRPGTSIYDVFSGISSGTAAKWNFDFSVNLCTANVSCPYFYQDVTTKLTLFDHVLGTMMSMDVKAIPDNAGENKGVVHAIATVGDTGFQNSENLGFAGIKALLDPGFDPFRPDTYDFMFSVFKPGDVLLDSVQWTAVVDGGAPQTGRVPEPGTVSLIGAGFLAAFGFSRRRSRTARA